MPSQSPPDALAVLVGASSRLGHHSGDLREALEAASPGALASVAESLVLLVRDPQFGRLALDDQEPLRVTLIEALLRVGYPWALEVLPDDLAYRAAERRRQQARRRGRVRRGLLLVVLALVAVGWALRPRAKVEVVDATHAVTEPFVEQPLQPALEVDALSPSGLEALVERGVRRAVEEARFHDALVRARDCASDGCRSEVARLVRRAEVMVPEDRALLSDVLRGSSGAPRGSTLGEREDHKPQETEAQTLAARASLALEAGLRNRALAAALECIDFFPLEAQCHRVVIAGLDGHERAERSREELAWILLRARRDDAP